MARVTNNSLLLGLSGRLGGVVFRQLHGQTIVSVAADPAAARPQSAGQQAQRSRFAEATLYAKTQLQDPAVAALYATGIGARHASAYHVALTDYLQGPTITLLRTTEYHGQPRQPLRVWATDNFAVVAVSIRICTADGELLEEGPATYQPGGHWLYLSQQPLPTLPGATVTALATDRPGNMFEATHTL